VSEREQSERESEREREREPGEKEQTERTPERLGMEREMKIVSLELRQSPKPYINKSSKLQTDLAREISN
jgi:hypothetical protein